MLSASSIYGSLTNGSLQALSATATATLAAAGNRLLPRIPRLGSCNASSRSSNTSEQQRWMPISMQAYRSQHSMVQEDEGLPEHVHEDPRLAKIEAVRKKVCACCPIALVGCQCCYILQQRSWQRSSCLDIGRKMPVLWATSARFAITVGGACPPPPGDPSEECMCGSWYKGKH
jgi:hypothetical protein